MSTARGDRVPTHFEPPRFVTVDGRRLAYEEVSPPEPERTVLLLCGLGAKRQGWYKQLPVLGRRFRTLALDPRDVGDSDPATGPYTIAELADDVAGLARALEIERASLIGVSMGGFIALELALKPAAALGRSAGPFPLNVGDDQRLRTDWHDVESYFRPNALGSYTFDANNNIVFNRNERLFDVAIMMDCSQCPIHPQLKTVFREYARKHSDTARKHGAKPVWFMSWAYADKPEMTEELAEAYTQAGNDSNAFVIPAGLAFARALKQRPELVLYAPDKRHPSVAGTYLAATTVYAALFKKSPAGLSYTAGLDAPTAALLQATAWDTVQDYFRAQQAEAK